MNEFFEEEEVQDEQLSALGKLVQEMEAIEATLKENEDLIKLQREELRRYSQDLIPTMIHSTGFSEVKLKNKKKVIVTDEMKCDIPKGRINEAYRQMIQAKLESDEDYTEALATAIIDPLFKSTLVVAEDMENAEKILLDNGIIFDKARTIHWATLAKYCKDTKSRGEKIPSLINVFEYCTTKIK
jgi:hypothetical protein